MSKITDIYDELYSLISTAFPNKSVLINAYDLADNNEQILKDGFGIAWETGTDTQQMAKQIIVFEREFVVNSVRAYYSTDLNKEPQKTTEKLLFEDQLTIIKTLRSFSEKSNNPLTNVEDIQFIDDSGIEFVFDDAQRYLALNSRFKILYTEKLY